MTESSDDPTPTAASLAPYQSEFIEMTLNESSNRVTLLRGAPGLGKSTALVELAARLLRQEPQARILVLMPAALRDQFVSRLQESGASTLTVDRYRFRELLDRGEGSVTWPPGVAMVASSPFAFQADVSSALAETPWDLVIVDEAHFLFGARRAAAQNLLSHAKRVVLATASAERIPPASWLGETATVRWDRDLISASLGFSVPVRRVHQVTYVLQPGELAVARQVRSIRNALAHSGIGETLLRGQESSPAALEGVVRNLMGAHRSRPTTRGDESEPGDDENRDTSSRPGAILLSDRAIEHLNELVAQLDTIPGDSKLLAFRGLVQGLVGAGTSIRRICVLTTRAATAYYLSAELEALGIQHDLVQGSMSVQDQDSAVSNFVNHGGILVATSVPQRHEALREVTELVLYDLPGDASATQHLLDQFSPLGRTGPLDIYVLVARNSELDGTSSPSESLRVVMSAATS